MGVPWALGRGIGSLVGNGFKCPLTGLAVKYGATKGYAFDTFLPERVTRLTFRVFGSLWPSAWSYSAALDRHLG